MPKLLYLVTEDWFFVSHFLPMARTARAAGFEVVVATRVRDHAARIEAEGCRVVPLEGERQQPRPVWPSCASFSASPAIVRAERPDIVHCIALRMVALGGLAARFGGAKRLVLAPTGLGLLWSEDSAVNRVARAVLRFVIGRWLRGEQTRYLFENTDDPREFGLENSPAVTIVPGAGVDPADFPALPEPPAPPLKVAVVARMIEAKGIADAVAAVRRARELGAPVELDLYGAPDPSNRRSCSEADLRQWSREPGIRWHGPVADVAEVWRTHHVAMLLTWYREGVPRSLIEAAASGAADRHHGRARLPRSGARRPGRHPGSVAGHRGGRARAGRPCRATPTCARASAAARMRGSSERFTEAAVRAAVGTVYAAFRL